MEVETQRLNEKIPSTVLLRCLSYCSLAEIIEFPFVCKKWRSIVDNDLFWKYYFINHFGKKEASKLQPTTWREATRERYNFEDFPAKIELQEIIRTETEFGNDILREISGLFYKENHDCVKAIYENVDGKYCENGKCKKNTHMALNFNNNCLFVGEFSRIFEFLLDTCSNVQHMRGLATQAMLHFDDPRNCRDYATAVQDADQLRLMTEKITSACDKYLRILAFLKR
jgi:hypothetical protein